MAGVDVAIRVSLLTNNYLWYLTIVNHLTHRCTLQSFGRKTNYNRDMMPARSSEKWLRERPRLDGQFNKRHVSLHRSQITWTIE